jgi:hypothetical protein
MVFLELVIQLFEKFPLVIVPGSSSPFVQQHETLLLLFPRMFPVSHFLHTVISFI